LSFPTEPDFAVIEIGNGATPEVFTVLCGIDQVSVNSVVNTSDRFRRDCAKPGAVPKRKVQAQGTQTDISGSGVFNITAPAFVAGTNSLIDWETSGGHRRMHRKLAA
jgi:hypothetical protein